MLNLTLILVLQVGNHLSEIMTAQRIEYFLLIAATDEYVTAWTMSYLISFCIDSTSLAFSSISY